MDEVGEQRGRSARGKIGEGSVCRRGKRTEGAECGRGKRREGAMCVEVREQRGQCVRTDGSVWAERRVCEQRWSERGCQCMNREGSVLAEV